MAYKILNYDKIYPALGGGISKWCAIGGVDTASHVKYQLLRNDGLATVIANGSGYVKLDSYGTPPSSLTIGGKIYLIAYSSGGVKLAEGLYYITAFSSGVITTTMPYSASYSAVNISFITDYANFYFRINYTRGGNVIATAIYTPGPNQIAWIDASPFLKDTIAITSKAIPASGNNDIADNADAYCQLYVYEVYDGPDGHYDDVSDGVDMDLYVVNAANQIQNPKGISLIDKITNATPSQTLKWLTDFAEPTFFKGYPFHSSFIYSELMTGAIDFEHTEYNSAGTSISTSDQTIDVANIGHVNRAFIRATLLDTTKIIKVKLKKHSGGTALSELLSIRYKNCGGSNAVCLKWMGLSGAWNFWVFNLNQTETLNTTSQQGSFKKFITDLATADTDSEVTGKEAGPDLSLAVDAIDVNDLTGLKTLLHSPKVMMLTNPETWVSDGVDKWITVAVKTGKFKVRETRGNLGGLELTIELPDIYIQTN